MLACETPRGHAAQDSTCQHTDRKQEPSSQKICKREGAGTKATGTKEWRGEVVVERVLLLGGEVRRKSFGPSSFSAGRDWLNPHADWLAAGFGENRDLFGTTKSFDGISTTRRH